jgi:hypothetical protein
MRTAASDRLGPQRRGRGGRGPQQHIDCPVGNPGAADPDDAALEAARMAQQARRVLPRHLPPSSLGHSQLVACLAGCFGNTAIQINQQISEHGLHGGLHGSDVALRMI